MPYNIEEYVLKQKHQTMKELPLLKEEYTTPLKPLHTTKLTTLKSKKSCILSSTCFERKVVASKKTCTKTETLRCNEIHRHIKMELHIPKYSCNIKDRGAYNSHNNQWLF